MNFLLLLFIFLFVLLFMFLISHLFKYEIRCCICSTFLPLHCKKILSHCVACLCLLVIKKILLHHLPHCSHLLSFIYLLLRHPPRSVSCFFSWPCFLLFFATTLLIFRHESVISSHHYSLHCPSIKNHSRALLCTHIALCVSLWSTSLVRPTLLCCDFFFAKAHSEVSRYKRFFSYGSLRKRTSPILSFLSNC